FSVPKHGFIRNNTHLTVIDHSENSLTFQYRYSDDTLESYPFNFEFQITFTVLDSEIYVIHEIANHGNDDMYFSLGGHPAFKCPLFSDENYEDYCIKFNEKE